MKKLIISVVTLVLCGSMVHAQDINAATDLYNAGATALNEGNNAAALQSFNEALVMAEALGDEGAELAANCKIYIPTIQFKIAKGLVNSGELDQAIEELGKTVEIARKYGKDEIAVEVESIIPQVYMQKANGLLNEKDYAGAIENYKNVLSLVPTNGIAALRLGTALEQSGDDEGAVNAYLNAMENGQEKAAAKQLNKFYLKNAAANLKAKKYAEAVDDALKSNEYGESPTAYQIAGTASKTMGKNADAAQYLEKYLELAPDAKNAAQIACTVAQSYQKLGNVAKAREYYKKAENDPKYGPAAKQQLEKLGK